MKTTLTIAIAAAITLCCGAAQTQPMPSKLGPKLENTCSITGKANDVRRIELLRLANGRYAHRAYGEDGKVICYSEWSATPTLNLQAAETLRAKGNNVATIVDHVFAKSE